MMNLNAELECKYLDANNWPVDNAQCSLQIVADKALTRVI
jgi:hypothetical protein